MLNSKKLLTLGVIATMAASAYSAAPGNRTFYAFTLGSAEFADGTKDYDYGFVAYPFDPTEEDAEIYGEMLDSYYDSQNVGVYAGAGVDGLLYACEYSSSGAMMQPVAGNLVVYNTINGTKEIIGQWNPENTDFKPQDMAWSEKDGKMYAVGYEKSQSGLYELDLKTAKFTKLCDLNNRSGCIAVHPNGIIYTMGAEGELYTINPENGKSAFVADTGLGSMMSNQSMDFDKATGLLYWVSSTTGHKLGYENSWLQEIDIVKKRIREVGSVGIGARIVGLHIPSAENLLAPGAPTSIKSVPAADGSLSTTLSWTNPTTTLNGSQEIGTLYGYIITRNGEQVKLGSTSEGDITPGATMEWTDTTIPSTGEYRYDIYFFNGKGNGAKGSIYQYAGPDAPGKVSDIQGEIAPGMKSLTLTWKAPESGRHLGAYDPASVKYTVTRSDNVVVAKDIKDCSVVDDDFIRVMKYSYTVTSSNEYGQSENNSGEFIIGPAFELPFEQTFENTTQVESLWTMEDANADGISWLINSTIGQAAFGDFESAAEYIVSPGLGNSDKGSADDWLISPPMALEPGTEYEFTISSRSYSTDKIEIWMGDKNSADAMTEKVGELSIEHNPENPDIDPVLGTVAFRRRAVAIPVMAEDATHCFGIHLVTKHPTHGYLQINGIYVGEKGVYGAVDAISGTSGDVNISLCGRQLTIFGEFKSAVMYDMNGNKAVSTNSALIDLSNLAAGVYVLDVDGKSFKIAL